MRWPFLHLTENGVLLCGSPWMGKHGLGVLLCGSPWMGKHGLGQNITVPLQGICLLRRGSENRIEALSPHQAVPLLLPLCAQPEDAPLLSAIANRVGLWRLQCTISPEAARTAHEAMSQEVSL